MNSATFRTTKCFAVTLVFIFCWLGIPSHVLLSGVSGWECGLAFGQDSPSQDTPSEASSPDQADEDAKEEVKTEEVVKELVELSKLKRNSPRETLATFLTAMDDTEQGAVERYPDALACLDLSGLSDLPEEARIPRARTLASLLYEHLKKQVIEVSAVPNEPTGEPHTFSMFEDEDGEERPAVQIGRRDDGIWLFTAETLSFVGKTPPVVIEGGTQGGTSEPAAPAPAAATPTEAVAGVPAEFRTAQDTMRTFLDAMKHGDMEQATRCLDLSDIVLAARSEKGEETATLLHEIIIRTPDIVVPAISDDPGGRPYILRQDEMGSIVIGRQGEGSSRSGSWLFTKTTVEKAGELYDALISAGQETVGDESTSAPFSSALWLRQQVPAYLKGQWFLLPHWQWIGLFCTLILGRFAQWIVVSFISFVMRVWLKRQHVSVDVKVQNRTSRPVGLLAGAAIWWIGLTYLSLRADVLAACLIAVKLVACAAAAWTLFRLSDLLADFLESKARQTATKVDDLIVPFCRRIAKTAVVIFSAVFLLQLFFEEQELTKIWAGLGLGGLAFALAAQDTLKNLFGSLTVILDRPFKVGDWVLIGDVEGTVESVGFRSTRVRTFYNSQITVPNSQLMSATVDNLGARRYRRFKTNISVVYSTPPEKIEEFCKGIRALVTDHAYTRKDYFHVYLNEFSPSSVDILLYCFFETPTWGMELEQREKLILDIMRLANETGIEFAFPTRTLHLASGGPEGGLQSGDA